MNVKLSTIAITMGLVAAMPQIYGMANPKGLAAAARKFPRHIPIGILLVLCGTVWFLYNLSQESIADFAALKPHMMIAFAGIGLLTCIFVHDFLAVRGLAIVLLCLARLMLDTGRPHLGESHWVLVMQVWAYVLVIAGIWLTISPWRLRDFIAWNNVSEKRTRAFCAVRLAFFLFMAVLGATVYRNF